MLIDAGWWSVFHQSTEYFIIGTLIIPKIVTKVQYAREKKKFIAKFGTLESEKAAFAKSQTINKEILSNLSGI